MKSRNKIIRIITILLITIGAVSGSIIQAKQLTIAQKSTDKCCGCCRCQADENPKTNSTGDNEMTGKCGCHIETPTIPYNMPTDVTLSSQNENYSENNFIQHIINLAIYDSKEVRIPENSKIKGIGPPIYIISSVLLI
ncbi:MAG: hypothetical protein ABIJ45_02635 [Candidatus Zixiibacteriota bacterium]